MEKPLEVHYPIHDKAMIELLKIMKDKEQISKKKLRLKTHPSFVARVLLSIRLLDYEIREFVSEKDMEMSHAIKSLFQIKKNKDNFRAIQVIRKNPNFDFQVKNDSLAIVVIRNGR